ncbi:MAG: AAA family ATPase [Bacteroidales bacterium]|nr:AAA family ATPase [Bacteroidales bacterium]
MKNEELELARQYAMFTNRNIFLTGKAGTGKTTFLRQLRQDTYKRNIVVAPTGVAAINANGVTIHSFFQLAPGLMPKNDAKFQFSKHKLNILRSLDLLIIDEISMVRCDLLDAIDEVLRRYQDRSKPFGGVQVLMIGDLQQLAPVATEDEWSILKERYTTPYFFSAKVFEQTNFTTIELKKVYRQDNEEFIRVLNNVRDNKIDQETLNILNSRYKENFYPDEKEGYITLTTHNVQAQKINQEHMDKLHTQPETFEAVVEGEFPETSFPTDSNLTLKVGAQVMFCKNDSSFEKRYYNGKIGRVAQIANNKVYVTCNDEFGEEEVLEVEADTWTNAKYETNDKTGEISEIIVGTFKQIPLKTAWAITIHKSQGLTFDKAIINAGKAFSFGQVYVALSRCRTLEGLVLSTPISRNVVMSDPTISAFNHQQEQNKPTAQQLSQDRKNYVAEIICSIFNFNKLQKSLDYVARLADLYLEKIDPEYSQKAKYIANETRSKLTDVGNRFAFQICDLMNLADSYEDNPQLQERFKKGNAYFVTKSTEILTDFMEEEFPVMKNKAHKERYSSEFELLKEEYELKTSLLIKTMSGFSLQKFWDAKARVSMTEDTAPKAKTGRKTKSNGAKSKSKKKGNK